MPFSVACSGCDHTFNIKDELEGKRLKCPRCGVVFQAVRQAVATPARPASPPPTSARPAAAPLPAMAGYIPRKSAVSDPDPDFQPPRFNLPFTLGPDDRYPRLLYWGIMLYFILDAIFTVPIFLSVLREGPNIDYHGQRMIGWAAAILVPPAVGACVFFAVSVSALIYGIYKFLLLGIVLTSALGSSMIGQSTTSDSVILSSLWHIAGIVLGVWYFMERRE